MATNQIVIIVLGALIHAAFVVVGIYVAINTRITRLEVKVDLMWANVKDALRRNGIDMREHGP
mgnify:CR=1 FL=1